MTATVKTETTACLTAVAATTSITQLAPTLAALLGQDADTLAARCTRLPAVLVPAIDPAGARRLVALLGLLGISVRVSVIAADDEDRFDLALQPVGTPDLARAVAALPPQARAVISLDPAPLLAALAGPGGLVLPRQTAAADTLLRRAIRRNGALRVLTVPAGTGRHDLFAPGLDRRARVALGADLRRLGLTPCAFSGAVAGNLDAATARHLVRRMGAGVQVLHRAFQRYDLVIAGPCGVPVAELADFLATRPGAARPRPADLAAGRDIVVDHDLPRVLAEAFVADYAAFGLTVRPRLRGFR